MPSATKVQTGFLEPQGPFTLDPGTASAPGLKFSTSAATGMFSPSTGALAFSTGSTQNALTINSLGNVGIGTTNPQHKLDVRGNLSVTDRIYLTSNLTESINVRKTFGNVNFDYAWALSADGQPSPVIIEQSSNDYSNILLTNVNLTYISGTQPSSTVSVQIRITNNVIDVFSVRASSPDDYDDTTVFELSTSSIGSGTQNLRFRIIKSNFKRPVAFYTSIGEGTEPLSYTATSNILKIGSNTAPKINQYTSQFYNTVLVGHNIFSQQPQENCLENALVGNAISSYPKNISYTAALGSSHGAAAQSLYGSTLIGYQASMYRNAYMDIGIGHETIGESSPRGTTILTHNITSQPTVMPANGTYNNIVFTDKLATKLYNYFVNITVSGGVITSVTVYSFGFNPINLPAVNDVMSTANATFAGMELTITGVTEIGGGWNVGVGTWTMRYLDGASYNTALGTSALMSTAAGLTGSYNTGLGHNAGSAITSGSYNVILGGNTGSDIATSSNNIIISDGAGNIRQFINSTGNVGIGTTNPNSRLDVFAGDGISITNSGDTFLQCRTTGTTATNYIEFKDSGGAVGAIAYNHTENSLWFKTNGSERLRIESNGQVIVSSTTINYQGTAVPFNNNCGTLFGTNNIGLAGQWSTINWPANHSVANTTGPWYLMGRPNGSTNTWSLSIRPGSTNNLWDIIGCYNDANGNIESLRFYTNTGNESLRINQSGNVGIGTTNPSSKLHVSGVARFNNSTNNLLISTNDGEPFIYVEQNAALAFGTNSSEKARFTTSGEFYIGSRTAAGQGKLFVNDSSGTPLTRVHIRNAALTGTAETYYNLDTAQFASVGLENGSLVFRNSNSSTPAERVRITNTGNVGIGTTNPLYKLDVRGDVWLNGASTQGVTVTFGSSPVTKTITITSANIQSINIVASCFTSGGANSAVKQFIVGGSIPGSTQYSAVTVGSGTTGSSISISDITKANGSFSFTMTLSTSLNSQGEVIVTSRFPVTISIT